MSVNIGKCSIIVVSVIYMSMVAIAVEPDQSIPTTRWADERCHIDFPIWSLLIKDGGYGNSGAEWERWGWGGKQMIDSKREASLQELLGKYPNSDYADDAALLLARARVFYDNDPDGAIKGLYQVIKDYPNGEWIAEDPMWLIMLPAMFALDHQGNKLPRPINIGGNIPSGSPAYKYLAYLETNPHKTADEAKYWIAKIILETDLKEKRYQEAINNLQEVVDKYKKPKFLRTDQDNESLKFMKECSLIVTEMRRAELRCHFLLVETYFDQKDYPDTIKTAAEFLANYDGYEYCKFVHRYAGESFEALQQWGGAAYHYEKFLELHNRNEDRLGLEYQEKLQAVRRKMRW